MHSLTGPVLSAYTSVTPFQYGIVFVLKTVPKTGLEFNNAQPMYRTFMQFADNAGQDQPVQMHRLIWAFNAHLQKQWILCVCDISKIRS